MKKLAFAWHQTCGKHRKNKREKKILIYFFREKINQLLMQGFIVLIDRYIHTNLAYSQIRVKKKEKEKKRKFYTLIIF